VTLTAITPGSTIRYTTTGLDPTETSPLYCAPIVIGTTTTLKVRGFKTDWTMSDVRTEVYTMNLGTLAPPAFTPAPGSLTFTPAPGEFVGGVTVTMSATNGVAVHVTMDNATASCASAQYAVTGLTGPPRSGPLLRRPTARSPAPPTQSVPPACHASRSSAQRSLAAPVPPRAARSSDAVGPSGVPRQPVLPL
jgi:hypothetical protein